MRELVWSRSSVFSNLAIAVMVLQLAFITVFQRAFNAQVERDIDHLRQDALEAHANLEQVQAVQHGLINIQHSISSYVWGVGFSAAILNLTMFLVVISFVIRRTSGGAPSVGTGTGPAPFPNGAQR